MGLIKTAMIAGAGIYAYNKIQKRREGAANPQQDPSYHPRSSQQYTDYGAPQQQYYPEEKQKQQQQHKFIPLEFSDRRSSQQQPGQPQPQYRLVNEPGSPVPSYGYNPNNGYYYEADQKAVPSAHGALPPPPQYQNYRPQHRPQGFVEELEYSDAGSVRDSKSKPFK